MSDYLVFPSIVLLFVVLLLGYVFIKLEDRPLQGLKDYFLYSEGKNGDGALLGIGLALVVTTVVGLLITGIYNTAKADEKITVLEYTEIYAGLDRTFKQSPQCRDGGVDKYITSNLGIDQHLVSYNNISVLGGYRHHSCAVNRDRNSYDAVTIQVRWRIE